MREPPMIIAAEFSADTGAYLQQLLFVGGLFVDIAEPFDADVPRDHAEVVADKIDDGAMFGIFLRVGENGRLGVGRRGVNRPFMGNDEICPASSICTKVSGEKTTNRSPHRHFVFRFAAVENLSQAEVRFNPRGKREVGQIGVAVLQWR